MVFSKNGIAIDISDFHNIRAFIKHCIEEVKSGRETAEDFVRAMEEVMTDPQSPLSKDDTVLMWAVKGNNERKDTRQVSDQDPGIKEHSGRSTDDRYNHASVVCCGTKQPTGA
jgi:DUF438 domain-containing protein